MGIILTTGLKLSQNASLVLENRATDPESPETGQIYYNTTDSNVHLYTSSGWVVLGEGGSGGSTSYKGVYNSSVTYVYGDYVKYNNNSYFIAINTNFSGKEPTVDAGYWKELTNDIISVTEANDDNEYNLVFIPENSSTEAQINYSATGPKVNASTGDIVGYQKTGNLVTFISAQSTDTQYPSAKCVYDLIGNIETALSEV